MTVRPRDSSRSGAGEAARTPAGKPSRQVPKPSRQGPGDRRRWTLVRAGNDAVPSSVRRFMQRARRRRMRAALPWAVVGVLLAVAGLLAWVVLGSGVLGVREVRVVGADLALPDEVRQAAAIGTGAPLARLDVEGIQARVGALAPVERATVTRQWPNAVTIEVVERTPVAVVPQGGGFAVVDRFGVPFQTVGRRPAQLPLVRVAAPGPDDASTRGALAALAALTPTLRDQLVEVGVAGPAEITLKLREGRTVVWGDGSRSEAKSTVATALLERDGDTIDVSDPEVVTIR